MGAEHGQNAPQVLLPGGRSGMRRAAACSRSSLQL